MIRAAGTIFAGGVTAISCSSPSAENAIPTVTVTFHVSRGLKGARTGEDFTIHQWIGLWNSGRQRYRMGEHVLLFLYPASKLGLSSWVAGPLGHFAIAEPDRIEFSPQHIFAFRADPVLGGKPSISIQDFAWAVRRASAGEGTARRQ